MRSHPDDAGSATPQPLLSTARTLADLHVQNNDRSAGLWDLYAGHRERLTALVAAAAPEGRPSRLLVLGAGNVNDMDLTVLADRFEEVHLADLDGAALARAVRREGAPRRGRLVTHADRDLSGFLESLPAWRERPPSVDSLARMAPLAGARVAAQLPGPFDVVVSDCLLSQIAWTCFRALGGGPLLMDVLDVMMAAHLRALVALTRRGGRCLFVTDVVSSETVTLPAPDASFDGEAYLQRLDERRQLFSGTSPALARLMLTKDPVLAREIEDVTLGVPWLWRVSQSRTVLVYALGFTRRA